MYVRGVEKHGEPLILQKYNLNTSGMFVFLTRENTISNINLKQPKDNH